MPGLNEYINAERRNKFIAAHMKHKWTGIVADLLEDYPKITKPVRLQFTWIEFNSRRDPDNIIFAKKFILDGMVEAGVLPKDTQEWIRGIREDWVVDKTSKGGVIITVTEIE